MTNTHVIRASERDLTDLTAAPFPPLPRWKYADVSCPDPADSGVAFVAPAITAADLVYRDANAGEQS